MIAFSGLLEIPVVDIPVHSNFHAQFALDKRSAKSHVTGTASFTFNWLAPTPGTYFTVPAIDACVAYQTLVSALKNTCVINDTEGSWDGSVSEQAYQVLAHYSFHMGLSFAQKAAFELEAHMHHNLLKNQHPDFKLVAKTIRFLSGKISAAPTTDKKSAEASSMCKVIGFIKLVAMAAATSVVTMDVTNETVAVLSSAVNALMAASECGPQMDALRSNANVDEAMAFFDVPDSPQAVPGRIGSTDDFELPALVKQIQQQVNAQMQKRCAALMQEAHISHRCILTSRTLFFKMAQWRKIWI